MSPEAPQPLIRLAAIIDMIAATQASAAVAEIALAVGLPKATAYRLIRNLVSIGYLEPTTSGRYQLGSRLHRVVSLATSPHTIGSWAQPVLSRAARHVGASVYVARLVGLRVKLTALAMNPSGVAIHPGDEFPPHASSAGRAIFAFQPNDVIDSVLSRPLRRYQPRTETRPDAVRANLASIKKAGVAECDEEMEVGIYAIARPVYGPGETVMNAAAFLGLKADLLSRFSKEQLANELAKLADELSSSLSIALSPQQEI